MSDPDALVELFEDAPAISHEVLHLDDRTVLLQYVLPFVPPPYRALLASGNLPQFPHTIRDGWFVTDLTTTHDRLSNYQEELEATGFRFEAVSVTQSVEPINLLTDRQHQFVTEALDKGYYDTPRQCSLTDLADKLGVSKSTASIVIHNAEETIIKEFFAEALD